MLMALKLAQGILNRSIQARREVTVQVVEKGSHRSSHGQSRCNRSSGHWNVRTNV
jgi:hypothetical protein